MISQFFVLYLNIQILFMKTNDIPDCSVLRKR